MQSGPRINSQLSFFSNTGLCFYKYVRFEEPKIASCDLGWCAPSLTASPNSRRTFKNGDDRIERSAPDAATVFDESRDARCVVGTREQTYSEGSKLELG